jgi:hypothetical protein
MVCPVRGPIFGTSGHSWLTVKVNVANIARTTLLKLTLPENKCLTFILPCPARTTIAPW